MGDVDLGRSYFGMGFTVALFINDRSKNIEMNDRQIEYYNSIKERDNIIIDLKGELMILKIQIENKKENTKMKTNKDIILVILAGLSICLGILLYFSVDYSKHLENQVSKMNLVINRDSLSKDYLDKTTWETDDLIKFSNNQTDEVIKLRKEKEMLLDSLRESSTF